MLCFYNRVVYEILLLPALVFSATANAHPGSEHVHGFLMGIWYTVSVPVVGYLLLTIAGLWIGNRMRGVVSTLFR